MRSGQSAFDAHTSRVVPVELHGYSYQVIRGPEVRTLLITHRGRMTVVELPERGTIVIGRSTSCDVFLDDSEVSRRHTAIHVEPAQVYVEDLGSHNGTLFWLETAPDTDETQTRRQTEQRLVPNQPRLLAADVVMQIGTAILTLQSASRKHRLESQPGVPGFVVVDPAMRRVIDLVDRIASTNLSVLLLGESGSGKDMFARYVHERSPRRVNRLVSLNCGALPETLLESELFGHEKGAFTGAIAAKPGLFEAAAGGTLFLDEVGELPLVLQVKLLRVLEDRQVLRVGALEPRTVDVRFIAATNRDLEQRIADGKFREDLYYRLNGIALHIPALRQRPTDIIPLAERFIGDFSAPLNKQPLPLSDAASAKLSGYNWPGNVRQLKNVVHRALVMCNGHEIGADDIVLPERESRPSLPSSELGPEDLRQRAEDAERRQILDALEACAGNQTRAAQRLGITRRALVRRLEKFDLPRPRRDPRTDED